MPRPPVKRSKVNHPNQARKRAPNNYPRSSPPTSRPQQLEEQLANKPLGQVPSDSDDSDLLVTRVKGFRDALRLDIYGSGGVAKGDKPAAHMSQSNRRLRASSQGGYGHEGRLNENRKNAPTQSTVLRPIDRHPSISRAATASTSGSPTSVRASPLAVKSSNVLGVTNRGTRTAETSILGPIKIRKRQPSILRSIASPHSSILDQELGDFLPDDESTPVNGSRKRKLSSPLRASSSTALRARSQPQPDDFNAASKNPSNTEPGLPPPLSSVTWKAQQPLSMIDSDIMALPTSSSSTPSPALAQDLSPSKGGGIRNAKVPKSLSTTALQALMPARRQQRTRRNQATKSVNEFEIPGDSNDPLYKSNETSPCTEESYVASPRPAKRTGKKRPQPGKLQKRKSPSNSKSNTEHQQVGKNKDREGGSSVRRPRRRVFSTQASSPSMTRGVPTVAKTSSQQQRQQQQHPRSSDAPVRTYSRRIGRGGTRATEAEEEDKENRPSTLSGGSSKQTRSPAWEDPGEQPTLLSDRNRDEELDNEINGEVGGFGDPEQARLARKFKEVDEWELEFEDVTSDGSAVDPLVR